jgi:hypothetical protein
MEINSDYYQQAAANKLVVLRQIAILKLDTFNVPLKTFAVFLHMEDWPMHKDALP